MARGLRPAFSTHPENLGRAIPGPEHPDGQPGLLVSLRCASVSPSATLLPSSLFPGVLPTKARILRGFLDQQYPQGQGKAGKLPLVTSNVSKSVTRPHPGDPRRAQPEDTVVATLAWTVGLGGGRGLRSGESNSPLSTPWVSPSQTRALGTAAHGSAIAHPPSQPISVPAGQEWEETPAKSQGHPHVWAWAKSQPAWDMYLLQGGRYPAASTSEVLPRVHLSIS